MPEKNKIYEVLISDYTAEGQGVAKIEGCAVFIPNAICGEQVRQGAKHLCCNKQYKTTVAKTGSYRHESKNTASVILKSMV